MLTAAAAVGVIVWLSRLSGMSTPTGVPGGAASLAWLSYFFFAAAAAADAWQLARQREPSLAVVALAAALPFYVAGWVATELNPGRLVTDFYKVRPLVAALFRPDFVARPRPVLAEVKAAILTPCDPAVAAKPVQEASAGGATLMLAADCAALGEAVTVRGEGFVPEALVTLTWLNPLDEALPLGETVVDAGGAFTQLISVPVRSIPEVYRDRPQRQRLVAAVFGPPGSPQPSETLLVILKNIGVTIALGLLATLLGAIVAVPLSILGARNLMNGSAVTRGVYWLVRLTLNVLRAIEPLILCVVFVVWVGPGPVRRACWPSPCTRSPRWASSTPRRSRTSTPVRSRRSPRPARVGRRWSPTPSSRRCVPPFTAFTVYRWDINVRMSTIIGFVGGGGVGFLLQQWINHGDWSEAATAVLVVAVVIMVLDALSSTVRRRLMAGAPLVGARWTWPLRAALALVVVWAWQQSEVAPRTLASGTTKIGPILGQLLTPELTARGVETETLTAETPVGCPPVATDLPAGADESTGQDGGVRKLNVIHVCGLSEETVDVAVDGLPPGAVASFRWLLPGGRRLPGARVGARSDGVAKASLEVRPLVLEAAKSTGGRVTLAAEVTHSVGDLRPSEAFWKVVDRLIATILMALMATTLGAFLAAPISLLAARNLMPSTPLGNAVYGGTRFALNLVRSVEPIIWASIFASWVGRGTPFAGVLALVVVTVASLGKLFSEAIENIDPGPLEALQATGANRLQTIAYAVVPQIMPPFLAFTIYHWDINVRISTVVGFVGGGGIGFLLQEWMNTVQWSRASVAIAGIILVVTLMDWASAKVRERFVSGSGRAAAEVALADAAPIA